MANEDGHCATIVVVLGLATRRTLGATVNQPRRIQIMSCATRDHGVEFVGRAPG